MNTVALGQPQRVRRANPILGFVRQQPVGAGAGVVILLMVLGAIFAPVIAPYDPVAVDVMSMLGKPDAHHWLGTDMYGRDILSRLIWGTRTELIVGFVSSFVGCSIGALIGTASAYFSGTVDLLIQRVIEVMLAIPIIITVMVVITVMGQTHSAGVDIKLISAISVPIIPNVTRVVRSSALSIRQLPYIEAARAAGYGHTRIILRHMLPNVAAPYLIMLTAYIAQAILIDAALAFLGLGITEPAPDWGLMLSGNTSAFYRTAPWMILFPGVAISITVFAFNLLGDSLRDWLDPKFKT